MQAGLCGVPAFVLFVFASLALQGIGWLHSADLVILKIDPASAATAQMINLHKF